MKVSGPSVDVNNDANRTAKLTLGLVNMHCGDVKSLAHVHEMVRGPVGGTGGMIVNRNFRTLVINYPRASFHMTPAPHPIQRCSAGRKRIIQGQYSIHKPFLLEQRRNPSVVELIRQLVVSGISRSNSVPGYHW